MATKSTSNKVSYYMASSASVQDESNSALWLATRAWEMELSYLPATTCHDLQENIPQKLGLSQ